MRAFLSLGLVLALASCGSSSSSSSTGTGHASGSGSETPVASGEDEGFDDEGATTTSSPIDHGTQSPHQLIGVHAPSNPSWAEMNAEQREWYMVGVLLPIEGESFDHYDHARYAQFECENCHGDDGRANHFAMPSRSLPPLHAPGSPQWTQMASRPAYTFMHDTVVPECATMLGMTPEAQPGAGGTGAFGCFNCHPHAQ
jgi:hypothetical protein